MVKFDENIDAVSLRQSVQLQTKVLTRPGPSVGYERACSVRARAGSFGERADVRSACLFL